MKTPSPDNGGGGGFVHNIETCTVGGRPHDLRYVVIETNCQFMLERISSLCQGLWEQKEEAGKDFRPKQ